jgi:hypothetical protein
MKKRTQTIKQRIDRSVPGIGRVALRTGARTIAEHRARVALFDRLIEAGQVETIGMLVRGEITWGELRQAQRKNRLHSDTLAADVALVRNLWVAIAATLKRMGKTESSRTRYELAFAQLKRLAVDFRECVPERLPRRQVPSVPPYRHEGDGRHGERATPRRRKSRSRSSGRTSPRPTKRCSRPS